MHLYFDGYGIVKLLKVRQQQRTFPAVNVRNHARESVGEDLCAQ